MHIHSLKIHGFKSFGDKTLFHFESGLSGVVGPNGSGKSSLVKTFLGLLKPVSGSYYWWQQLPVAYVPQRISIDQNIPMRVIDLLNGGLESSWSFINPFFRGKKKAEIDRAIHDVDLKPLLNQQFSALSEGQKQRVLMGRALVSNPQLLVLDEPTSAMDIATEEKIFHLTEKLKKERNLTVIIIAHHIPVLLRHISHIMILSRENQAIEAGLVDDVIKGPLFSGIYGSMVAGHCNA